PPCGSLLGGFYTNESGQLVCGGYQVWCEDADNNQLAIPLWASESGLDNGFLAGEEITWLLYVGNQTFNANSITMTNAGPFSDTFVTNGFGQLTAANYECEVTGVLGCTDPTAYNYSSSATIDDGSCYNLDWDFTITDCNMTILMNEPEITSLDISLNGGEIPVGAMIGVFYENSNGQLVCGGASEWTGTSGAVAAMGSESGLDNGFQIGDLLNTWFLLIGNQTIPMDSNGATMSNAGAFQDNYVCNGFGNLLSVNFEGEYTLTYGCTDSQACNYDESAMMDDESCYYPQTWYQDSDGDGLGNPDNSTDSCDDLTGFGYVTNNDDPCPNTDNNPNNAVVWYLDSDGDGLGEDQIVTTGCEYIGSDNFPLADNNDDPCPNNPLNEDVDEDGITDCADNCVGQIDQLGICNGDCAADIDEDGVCDDEDDCVGTYDACDVCNGPGEIYECGCADIAEGDCDCNGNVLDAIYVCGGDCEADVDEDGICDDEDDCVGAYDNCDVCNGPGQIYECGCTDIPEGDCDCNGNVLDVISVCGGDCEADVDEDGICDDEDDCVGVYDSCGICNGPGDSDGDGVCDGDEIEGCQDATACNYDPTATDSCEESCCTYALEGETCAGCTDPTACNYSAGSTIDDGSCLTIYGCNDENACNYDPIAECDDGSCEYDFGCGCGETAAQEGYDCNDICLNDIDNDGVCDEFEIAGCQDNVACNYDSTATDPAECIYPVEFYDCDNNCLNDMDNDGVCDELDVGCMDATACNYDDSVTGDDGSCVYVVEFYDCNNNCLNDLDNDGVCDELEIEGCTNPIACNYNPEATNTCLACCTYIEETCDTCEGGVVIDNDIDNDGICNDDEIPGCTDPTACNFDPELGCTDDDGSCFYSEITVEVSTQNASCEAICDGVIELTINNGQPPYNVEYNLVDSDGNVETTITAGNLTSACPGSYGVLVSDAYNCESEMMMIIIGFDEPDSDNDGVCDNEEINGCTDPNACNYNSSITEDDGSCEYCSSNLGDIDGNGFDDCELINNQSLADGNEYIYDCNGCINDDDFDGVCDELEIIGCTDQIACNYNNQATESCLDDDNDGVLDCCNYAEYYLDCEGNCLNDTDQDGVCDEFEITGCNDDTACNYDETATEDTDCIYAIEFYDCEGNCLNDNDNDAVCDEVEIEGCQEGNACNYNPEATDPCIDCCAFLDEDGDGFPNLMTVVETVQNIICPGDGNGGFVMYTTGGLAPYALTVDGQELSSEDGIFAVENLSGGSYNVFLSDANGCEIVQTVDIEEPDPLNITIEYLNYVSCEGYGDGSLTNSIEGGTPPYEFEWLDGAGNTLSTNQDIFDLDAGAYALSVIDDNGCESQSAFIVGDPNPLEVVITETDVSCYDGNNGNVSLYITGGASPYTDIYTDSDGAIANPSLLSAGDYIVTVTDNNGCVFIDDFTISQPPLLEVSITSTDTEMCEDDNDIIITASPNNFTSYILSQIYEDDITMTITESSNNVFGVNETGEYIVTGVNQNGCEAVSNSINISVFENPTIDINGQTEVVTGDTYTYYVIDSDQEYEWTLQPSNAGTILGANNQNSVQIIWTLPSPGPAQIYLTQTDENGCSNTGFIDINVEWPTALGELSEEMDFIVYPNPFITHTTIEVNNPYNTNYDLYLYDIKGVLIKAFINQNENKIQLEKKFASGVYHLHLISKKGNKRKLIIVE
ncbi:MAG: hypothetical protein CMP50_04105, partial [Flavobacteriales bacterium]|nr:hypothetical protein [Flavobacteriales bacterium]